MPDAKPGLIDYKEPKNKTEQETPETKAKSIAGQKISLHPSSFLIPSALYLFPYTSSPILYALALRFMLCAICFTCSVVQCSVA